MPCAWPDPPLYQISSDLSRLDWQQYGEDLSEYFEGQDNLRDFYSPISLFTVNMPFVMGPKIASWDPLPGLNSINGLESAKPAQ